MRTLYLVRHAKASLGDGGGRDFDRPLERQGSDAAARVGKLLSQESLIHPLFLSSPALRARDTAEIIQSSSGIDAELQFDSRIYEADLRSLLNTIGEISDEVEAVILVGHNPGMESLLRFLTGELRAMPTSALAKIELKSSSWSNLGEAKGHLISLTIP